MICIPECFKKKETAAWQIQASPSLAHESHPLQSGFPLHSPGCSHHRQRDGQADPQTGPHEGRGLCEEPAKGRKVGRKLSVYQYQVLTWALRWGRNYAAHTVLYMDNGHKSCVKTNYCKPPKTKQYLATAVWCIMSSSVSVVVFQCCAI